MFGQNWLKDLEIIEKKYQGCGEEPGYSLDHFIDVWEDEEDDEEVIDSACDLSDVSSPQVSRDHEARMVERLRCVRKDYETNSKLMREECILTWDNLGMRDVNKIEERQVKVEMSEIKKEMCLFDWYISLTSQLSVIVIGRREDNKHAWQTTAIRERINGSPTKLRTFSGTVYTLEDEIDEKSMKENYFPDSITEKFRYGFPQNWQTMIKNFASKFGFKDKSTDVSKQNSGLTYHATVSSNLQGALSKKRKWEKPCLSPKLSPHENHLLPKKRVKIENEAMPDIFEVLESFGNTSKDSISHQNESKLRIYPDRVNHKNVKCKIEIKSEVKDGPTKQPTRTNKSLSKLKSKKMVSAEMQKSYDCIDRRKNWKEEIKGEDEREAKELDDSANNENIEGSLSENNETYLLHQDVPLVRLERVDYRSTPKLNENKGANAQFNGGSIKIQRRRRVRRCTQKKGQSQKTLEINKSLTVLEEPLLDVKLEEMKENGSSKINHNSPKVTAVKCKTPSENCIKPYSCNRNAKMFVEESQTSSSEEDKDLEKDMKRLNYRYETRNRRRKRILENEESRKREEVNENEVAVANSDVLSGKSRIKRLDRVRNVKGNERKRKVLKPKVKFPDDWDDDIHFGSDGDTESGIDKKKLTRLYPLRSRSDGGSKTQINGRLAHGSDGGLTSTIDGTETRSCSGTESSDGRVDDGKFEDKKLEGFMRRKYPLHYKGAKLGRTKQANKNKHEIVIESGSPESRDCDRGRNIGIMEQDRNERKRRGQEGMKMKDNRNGKRIGKGSSMTGKEGEKMEMNKSVEKARNIANLRNERRNEVEMKCMGFVNQREEIPLHADLDWRERNAFSNGEYFKNDWTVNRKEWNQTEDEKLQFALCTFRPETQHGWQKVAYFVGTKSPTACQRKYEELIYPSKVKKVGKQCRKLEPIPKKKNVERIKEIEGANFNDVVTAKRGTLRRKKQMREFLDAYDRGYEDNIFDSTPYRNRSQKIKLPFDVAEMLDSSEDEESTDVDVSGSSCTVSSINSTFDSPSNLYKTNILLPASRFARDAADAYVHKLQKLRKTKTASSRNRTSAKETRSREPKTDFKKFESPSAYFRVEDRCDYDDYDDSNPDDEYFDEEILK